MKSGQVVVIGGAGRLGSLVCELLKAQNKNVVIPNSSQTGEAGFWKKTLASSTVVIDVSLPEGTMAAVGALGGLEAADLKNLRLFLSGVTGLKDAEFQKLQQLGQKIPVCHTTNFSKGVFFFQELLKAKTSAGKSVAQLAKDLGFDLGMVETHHIHKKDAPSGTAKTLAAAGNIPLDKVTALRCGEVVGEHTVVISGSNEEIKITHTAFSRKMFAEGAVKVALSAFEKSLAPKFYEFSHILTA